MTFQGSQNRRLTIARISLAFAAIVLAALAYFLWPARDGIARIQTRLSPDTVEILVHGENFVLLSLDPTNPAFRSESDAPPEELFREFGVLGKTEIRNQQERALLLNSLFNGIADNSTTVASCFNPRHGISASLGDRKVDVVICFECLSMRIFSKNDKYALTTCSPASVFNRSLARAGLPIAK
jgi:hypothetical protein